MSGLASTEKESGAFISWVNTFQTSKEVVALADLSDGAALFEVLSFIDRDYFRQSTRPSAQPSDNIGLQVLALQRLYRLVNQYFTDVLRKPTSSLEVPDLHAIVKERNTTETLRLCRLVIAIAVQSEKKKEVIEKIQSLREGDQAALMRALEQTMARLAASSPSASDPTDDDQYYQLQVERSRLYTEKETLEKVYQALIEEHRALQSSHDDITLEKDDALARVQELRREMDDRRNEKADGIMRAEIDRLRSDLQKSEDNLGMAENEVEKQSTRVKDLTRKVEELQVRANEAVRLKDQVDEYRHAAEKLQKTENVMEKYKKKLEESADLRRTVKSLEEQNASLVDRNAALEQENQKVAGFKPLMESYKSQISELETKSSAKQKEIEGFKFELQQAQKRLKLSQDERAKDAEALELYQERVRELELLSTARPTAISKPPASPSDPDATLEEDPESNLVHGKDLQVDIDVMAGDAGLGGEIEDALSGRTMTDLKLQVRRLQKELEAVKNNTADASRTLVLENLLEDSNRMKARYESDYLTAHREKLVLQNTLEEIRAGKSMGDGPEAAIALRQRLNETVDQLNIIQARKTELEVENESLNKTLIIAKSDLNLVNKDQLDILASLRESVNEDKAGLEAELENLQGQIRDLREKNKMQLEQVNGLLMEKVTLQSDSIGQREKMLARERDFGALRASFAGQGIPEEAQAKMLAMHEETVQLKEQLKTAKDNLSKAKQFIKSQDKLFKDEMKTKEQLASAVSLEEADGNLRSQIKILEEDLSRQKRLLKESEQRYRQEQQLMLSVVQEMGMRTVRNHHANPRQRSEPSSWLGQQRRMFGQGLTRQL